MPSIQSDPIHLRHFLNFVPSISPFPLQTIHFIPSIKSHSPYLYPVSSIQSNPMHSTIPPISSHSSHPSLLSHTFQYIPPSQFFPSVSSLPLIPSYHPSHLNSFHPSHPFLVSHHTIPPISIHSISLIPPSHPIKPSIPSQFIPSVSSIPCIPSYHPSHLISLHQSHPSLSSHHTTPPVLSHSIRLIPPLIPSYHPSHLNSFHQFHPSLLSHHTIPPVSSHSIRLIHPSYAIILSLPSQFIPSVLSIPLIPSYYPSHLISFHPSHPSLLSHLTIPPESSHSISLIPPSYTIIPLLLSNLIPSASSIPLIPSYHPFHLISFHPSHPSLLPIHTILSTTPRQSHFIHLTTSHRRCGTSLYRVYIPNQNVMQGCFRLCNWLSLWRLGLWINVLCPVCRVNFWYIYSKMVWSVSLVELKLVFHHYIILIVTIYVYIITSVF